MLLRFTFIPVLIVIILQSFSSSVIVAAYEINKDFISINLCENRNRSLMQCNGKCHLNKELHKEHDRDQNPTASAKEKQETVQYVENSVLFAFNHFQVHLTHSIYYLPSESQEVNFSVFHPPTV